MSDRNSIIQRLTIGLPPQVGLAAARVIASGKTVDDRAALVGHIDGRTFSVPAGTAQRFQIQWNTTFIIDKFRVTSDTPRLVEIRASKPNETGYLIGDTQNGVRVDVPETTNEWTDLMVPWTVFPTENFEIEVNNTSGAPVRVNVGFGGAYVYGVR
jgi:hypothetical protein